ncbi:AlpA family transcriptional regulator [Mycobacterium sp. 852002-51613_SCH5001154]|uniref:helix-turn-helix transcriptional regulator n=1 Tax=Mycobacterium sp. 852002-51613_SCH5001154 TaxID=1834104 RepID=UPI000B0F5C05|nr:DNA-binding protein [Mycobacterium sp. 852002-51613_SCH5001154]
MTALTVTFTNPDALFLPSHVAEHRHMSENALAQERFAGTGPCYVKLGRRVYYRASDLKAWLDANLIKPEPSLPQRD